eukprot:scaffold75592_cov33-Tisochrysis_lutea.AAC.1
MRLEVLTLGSVQGPPRVWRERRIGNRQVGPKRRMLTPGVHSLEMPRGVSESRLRGALQLAGLAGVIRSSRTG